MRARKNKRNIFFRKSSWLLILIFIATLITIPAFNTTKAEGREIANDQYFKILNIDPGAGEFTIGTGTSRNYDVPNKTISVEGQNRNIRVTRISMAEFISMTDEIKGQYDAVVVGRKNTTNLSMNFSTTAQYRDYSPPFYQQLGNLFYTDADGDETDTSHPSGYVYPFTVDKGKTFIEYYSENDITKKRADELTAMISSNELVYFDNDIFKDELKTSNIYTIFNPQSNKKTFSHSATSDSIIQQIINDYTSLAPINKRPVVDRYIISADDDGVNTPLASARNMNIVVTLNGKYTSDEISAKLFLDIDADTRYIEEDEGIKNLEYTVTNTGTKTLVTIKNTINRYFIGYLDWKVEIIKKDGAKTYITNHSIYKGLNGYKKKLNVLQIHPRSTNELINKGSLYLSTGGSVGSAQQKFNTTLTDSNLLSLGYELTIHTYPVDNVLNANKSINTKGFNESIEDGTLKLKDFDMIIIGFADSYSNNQFTLKATNAIQAFIEEGRSALFTHDTITLNTFGGNHTDNTEWNMNCGPKLLGQKLRDYLGQARYVDNYRDGIVKDINKKDDIYHDELIPDGSNGALYGKNSENTKYSVIKASDNADTNLSNNKLFSMGATLYMNAWESSYTNTVRSMNSSQITSYPYDLNTGTNDNGITRVDGVSTFGVSQTHTQWFQLNLEDPEVVPLYNLSNSNFDSGDSRNYYYTYSRRNVTYSGTGHTSTDYANQPNELKLFINTIVKASRGANNPANITNMTMENKVIGEDIGTSANPLPKIQKSSDYDFITMPTDMDKKSGADDEGMKVTVTVDGNNVQEISSNGSVINGYINDAACVRKSGDQIHVRIPKALFQNKTKVTVTTTVADKLGEGETKSFDLAISSNEAPTIKNYDMNGDNEIVSDQEIPVTGTENYNFKTLPTDPEGKPLTLTVKLKDGTVIKTTSSVVSGVKADIEISQSYFVGKNPGDKIDIIVTAKDDEGAEASKGFTLVITNEPPTITNYKNNGSDVIAENDTITIPTTSAYNFKTEPIDPEGMEMTLKVELDGTLISTTLGATSGVKANLVIPQTSLEGKLPGTTLNVVVKAIDFYGVETSKSFTLVIENPAPTISHSLVEDTGTYFPGKKYVYYFKNHNFVGDITGLYDKNATIVLKLDYNETLLTTGGNIKLIGQIAVEKVNGDGTYTPLGNMTGSNGLYSYTLSNSDITITPANLRVRYIAEIYKLPPVAETSYKNTLSIGLTNTPVTIRTLQPNGEPDLF